MIGTFNVCRLVAAAMHDNTPDGNGNRGVIVNTGGISSFEGETGEGPLFFIAISGISVCKFSTTIMWYSIPIAKCFPVSERFHLSDFRLSNSQSGEICFFTYVFVFPIFFSNFILVEWQARVLSKNERF